MQRNLTGICTVMLFLNSVWYTAAKSQNSKTLSLPARLFDPDVPHFNLTLKLYKSEKMKLSLAMFQNKFSSFLTKINFWLCVFCAFRIPDWIKEILKLYWNNNKSIGLLSCCIWFVNRSWDISLFSKNVLLHCVIYFV